MYWATDWARDTHTPGKNIDSPTPPGSLATIDPFLRHSLSAHRRHFPSPIEFSS